MGYTTDFEGKLKLNKVLDIPTWVLLDKLSKTRRMKRNMPDTMNYGVEGEFYVDGGGFMGQDHDDTILDYNTPPSTQPSLWCQWQPTEDGQYIEWNGGEKFYNYVEWLEYLIENILAPKGYKLTGVIRWVGEDSEDQGAIVVKDNVIDVRELKFELPEATN